MEDPNVCDCTKDRKRPSIAAIREAIVVVRNRNKYVFLFVKAN